MTRDFITVLNINTGFIENVSIKNINTDEGKNYWFRRLIYHEHNIYTYPEEPLEYSPSQGFEIWKKEQIVEYIKANGIKAYIEMRKEKDERINKELVELKCQEEKDGIIREEDKEWLNYSLGFEFYDYPEYIEYLNIHPEKCELPYDF